MYGSGNTQWMDDELRLATLQILLDQRRLQGEEAGASEKMIAYILEIERCPRFKLNMDFLMQNGFIEKGNRVLKITPAGYDFLLERLGGLKPERGSLPVLAAILSKDEGLTLAELEAKFPGKSATELEFSLWYLSEKKYIEEREQKFRATMSGITLARRFATTFGDSENDR
jgi:hypothetical protein